MVCLGWCRFLKMTSKTPVKIEAWFSSFLFSQQLWLKNACFKVPLLYQRVSYKFAYYYSNIVTAIICYRVGKLFKQNNTYMYQAEGLEPPLSIRPWREFIRILKQIIVWMLGRHDMWCRFFSFF